MHVYGIALIFIPFIVQIFAQYRRVGIVVAVTDSEPVSKRQAIFDLWFWASVSNLLLLVFIAALLRHVDGLF